MNTKKLFSIKTAQKKLTLCAVLFIFSLNALVFGQAFGFKLVKTQKFKETNQVYLYEHEKTGAKVVWIKNEDTNRAFNLAFNTRAYDDVGLPHIFEHSCLAGSEKYPSSNLFFQMGSQTYNTFMNALTYQLFTCYPMSSLSEEQLFASLDVYMNGVFHPIVLTEENDLRREAVRFVLKSPDEKITATGAVYNELLGVMSDKNKVNYYALRKLLYPNSTDSYITGGNPEDILNVTWQSVKDFHKKYYHPSNMTVYLYGKLDCDRMLEYFDREFFSKYDRVSVDLSDVYEGWEGFREESCEFPVTSETNTKNASLFTYAITLDQADLNTYNDLIVFNTYNSQDSSWLYKTMKEKFPQAVFDLSVVSVCQYPYYAFEVENINEEDKDELKAIFCEAVERFCQQKLEKSFIDNFANVFKMSNILDEEHTNGVSLLRSAALFNSCTNNPLHFIDARNALINLPKTSNPQTVLNTVTKQLLTPKQSAVLITKPVAGLAEKKDAENAKYFADKKAGMSKQQINDLIAQNDQYEKWLADNEKINLIDKVKVVGVEDLPEETINKPITDKTEDGIRYLLAENKGMEYISARFIFDMASLPAKYYHPVMLYFALLESLPTKNFTLEELNKYVLENIYSTGFYTSFKGIKNQEDAGGTKFMAEASFKCLNSKLKQNLYYIEEVLFNTELTDFDTIRSKAGRIALSRKQGYLSEPNSLGVELSYVASHPAFTNRFYTARFDYWDFLEKVSKMTDEELAQVTNDIKDAISILFNKNNLTVTCIADKKQINNYLKNQKKLISRLESSPVEKQLNFTEHKRLPKSIAVVIPGNSYYNYRQISLSDLGIKDNAKYDVLSTILSEQYLFQTLRYKNGAYGAGSYCSDNGLLFYSYRDPNVKSTYSVFDQASKGMAEIDITQSLLEGYITSQYSYLAKEISMTDYFSGKISSYLCEDYEENAVLRYMKETKGVKLDDIKEFIELIKKIEKDGTKVTIGASDQIYANKDMFDLIITDFIK